MIQDMMRPETPLTPEELRLEQMSPVYLTKTAKARLVENCRLEFAEHSRSLRATYKLQAQNLRTRVESRINRIPAALRNMTMGEMMERYEESKREELRRIESEELRKKESEELRKKKSGASVPPPRPLKRKSEAVVSPISEQPAAKKPKSVKAPINRQKTIEKVAKPQAVKPQAVRPQAAKSRTANTTAVTAAKKGGRQPRKQPAPPPPPPVGRVLRKRA